MVNEEASPGKEICIADDESCNSVRNCIPTGSNLRRRFTHWPLWLLLAVNLIAAQFAEWPAYLLTVLLPDSWQSFSLGITLWIAGASALHMSLGFWIVFLPTRWWIRLLVIVGMIAWFAFCEWWNLILGSTVAFTSLVLGDVVFFLATLRWRFRLQRPKHEPGGLGHCSWQFGLLHLSIAATMIILFFALPRLTARFDNQAIIAAVLALPMALMACWAMLGPLRVWLPVMLTLGTSVGYALLFTYADNEYFVIDLWETILAFLFHTILLLLMFGLARASGYRLCRSARRGQIETSPIET